MDISFIDLQSLYMENNKSWRLVLPKEFDYLTKNEVLKEIIKRLSKEQVKDTTKEVLKDKHKARGNSGKYMANVNKEQG